VGAGAAGLGLGMGAGMLLGGGRRRRGFGLGGFGFGRRQQRGVFVGSTPNTGGGGGCGGCMGILMVIVIIIIAFAVISSIANFSIPTPQNQHVVNITQNTRIREPLATGLFNEVGPLFTDHLGIIENRSVLENGMRHFQRATGVRPHLYTVGEIFGTAHPSNAQLEQFARDMYGELFDDHGHVLVVFFENYEEVFSLAIWAGAQAQSVIDQEAMDILMDFMELYYMDYVNFPQTSQAFSRAFTRTADTIMFRPPDNRPIWIAIAIVAGVVLLSLILFAWWNRKQEQKRLEDLQTERILNQPLQTFGAVDDEAARLAKQYEDQE